MAKQTKQDRIDELEREVAELEESLAENNPEALADQLDSLAVALESIGMPGGRLATSVPQTPAQWARCLRAIAKGIGWEDCTWR